MRDIDPKLIHEAVDHTEALGVVNLRVMATAANGETQAADGRIDFRTWTVEVADRTFVGGQMIRLGEPYGEPSDPVMAGTPLWMIEALRGVTAVLSAKSVHTSDAVDCEVDIDLVDAVRQAPVALALPNGYPEAALTAAKGECQINRDGCLSRVAFIWDGYRTEVILQLPFT